MILGFFVLMTGVDAVFIVLSSSSYPGTVTANPYQKGMGYNKVLQQARQQDDLGWKIHSKVINGAANKISYELTIKDKNNVPINDADITLQVVRPLDEKLDFSVQMQAIKNGLYKAAIVLPKSGQWELRCKISQHGHDLYHRERIVTQGSSK